MKPIIQDTIQLLKNPRTFYLYFGPYGIGVSRPILRERATFGTLNQLVSESGKPPIPHGLVVRIRAFHARGRGSIPRGGVSCWSILKNGIQILAALSKRSIQQRGSKSFRDNHLFFLVVSMA